MRVLSRIWDKARTVDDPDPARAAAVWQQRRDAARAYADRSYRLLAPMLGNRRGRFLDIACGLGETVHRFASAGWDAEGIDADPATLAFHRQIGIRSRIGQIENLEVSSDFDVIQIAHAIYFITDPMRFLRRVHSLLAPGGAFCVVLSDFTAAHDSSLPSYAHSFFPTRPSMRYALALAGFETVLVRAWSGSVYIVTRAGSPAPPAINTPMIHWRYRTKKLRYALLGRPYLTLRKLAKKVLRR